MARPQPSLVLRSAVSSCPSAPTQPPRVMRNAYATKRQRIHDLPGRAVADTARLQHSSRPSSVTGTQEECTTPAGLRDNTRMRLSHATLAIAALVRFAAFDPGQHLPGISDMPAQEEFVMQDGDKLHVGVAVDGSALSEKALRAGCSVVQAARRDGLSILHVAPPGQVAAARHLSPQHLKHQTISLATDFLGRQQVRRWGGAAPVAEQGGVVVSAVVMRATTSCTLHVHSVRAPASMMPQISVWTSRSPVAGTHDPRVCEP